MIPFQLDASGISRILRLGWILGIQRSQSARDLKDLPPSKASVGVLFWSITQDWFYIECKYLDWWEEKHITYYIRFVFTVGCHWKWQASGFFSHLALPQHYVWELVEILLGMVKLPSCLWSWMDAPEVVFLSLLLLCYAAETTMLLMVPGRMWPSNGVIEAGKTHLEKNISSRYVDFEESSIRSLFFFCLRQLICEICIIWRFSSKEQGQLVDWRVDPATCRKRGRATNSKLKLHHWSGFYSSVDSRSYENWWV